MITFLPLLSLPRVFQTCNRLLVSCSMSFKFPKNWLMKPCTLVLSYSRLSRLNAGELEDGVTTHYALPIQTRSPRHQFIYTSADASRLCRNDSEVLQYSRGVSHVYSVCFASTPHTC